VTFTPYQYIKYDVGDIVCETEIMAYHPKGPMVGIVISITRRYFHFSGHGPEDTFFQDKLTIFWFKLRFVEELPADLVYLISPVNKEKEIK